MECTMSKNVNKTHDILTQPSPNHLNFRGVVVLYRQEPSRNLLQMFQNRMETRANRLEFILVFDHHAVGSGESAPVGVIRRELNFHALDADIRTGLVM